MSKKLPVAIQVYGLRDLLENTPENFKSVMEQAKALGYDGVELGRSVTGDEIRAMAKSIALREQETPFCVIKYDFNEYKA